MAAQAEVQLVYDGLGRCVKRTVAGVATIIIYDGWKPIAEWDGWTEDYFQAWNVYGPGPDEILLRHDAKMGYIRYHSDANGNVKFLLDNDGQVVEKYTYDAFGRPKIMGPEGEDRTFSHWTNRFLFQGREYIGELGVYDYRNRFYHPELGRFLQVDPTGFDAGDMNLFRYVGDDPINGSDPDGLEDLRMFSPKEGWRKVYDAGPLVYDIGAHGEDGKIFDERGKVISARRLYNRIKNEPAFKRANAIKLWVCDAAKGRNPIVRQLAAISGKRTYGPDNLFWERGGKSGTVAPSDKNYPKGDKMAWNLRGRWMECIPGQSAQATTANTNSSSATDSSSSPDRARAPESPAQAPESPDQSHMLDFMLDGVNGSAGVSGAPPVSRPR